MKNLKHWTFVAIIAFFGFAACDNGNNVPTYESITISPNTEFILQGSIKTFTATVNGKNNPSQSVTWTVEGGKIGTSITNGVL